MLILDELGLYFIQMLQNQQILLLAVYDRICSDDLSMQELWPTFYGEENHWINQHEHSCPNRSKYFSCWLPGRLECPTSKQRDTRKHMPGTWSTTVPFPVSALVTFTFSLKIIRIHGVPFVPELTCSWAHQCYLKLKLKSMRPQDTGVHSEDGSTCVWVQLGYNGDVGRFNDQYEFLTCVLICSSHKRTRSSHHILDVQQWIWYVFLGIDITWK